METISLTCRVCLENNQTSNSLFDEVKYEAYVKLSDIFQRVTNIEIPEDELLKPTRICQQCTERLLNAYEFVCSVEKAELQINDFLNEDSKGCQEQQELPTCIKIMRIDDSANASDEDQQDLEVLDDEFQQLYEEDCDEKLAEVILPHDEEVFVKEEKANASKTGHQRSPKKNQTTILNGKSTTSPTYSLESPPSKPYKDTLGSRLNKRLSTYYHKCNDCGRTFARIATLEKHIRQAHTYLDAEKIAEISPLAAGEKRIECPHCPRIFVRKDNYARHLITVHSDEAKITAEDREHAKTKHHYKRGLCPHCGESFSQASLIIHIRRHTGENPYKCEECEKAFPRRQDLVIHQRQHTGERPHVCSACGKSFTRANKLSRHMRIHTGQRPYKCTECERSFVQSNDLKIHMRRHTGEKPYKCGVCSEAFICGSALRTHRRLKSHNLPDDDMVDPFANWRVSTRKGKVLNMGGGELQQQDVSTDNCDEDDNVTMELIEIEQQ